MSKISIEQVRDMHTKLKEQYPNWAKLLADVISKEKEWKRYKDGPISQEAVTHIKNGNTNSQLHRRLFIIAGAKLLRDAAQQVEGAINLVEEVDNANN